MAQLRTGNTHFPLFKPIVLLVAGVWLTATVLAVALGNRYGLFDRPSAAGRTVVEQIMASQSAAVEALAVIALVFWLTRHRPTIDAAAIGIRRNEALYALRIAAAYGFISIMGGYALGTALGTYAFSFHLPGTLVGAHSHDLVTRTQAISWSIYNLLAYVVIPFVYLRKRFPSGRSFLTSNNLRADTILIAVVLVVESIAQFFALSDAMLDLSISQLAVGAPLSFLIYLFGTGLPTMVFVQVIIVPRLVVVTGSVTASVILGGVAYTLVHMPESWMEFSSPLQVILSTILLFFTYFFPGMVKAVMSLRTGNAWVHLWAYHAIAPHVIIDTPLIVAIFGIS